jgi:ABC-type transport system involved in cytochrome bd biosynthesis fused ATPase/permease subunit
MQQSVDIDTYAHNDSANVDFQAEESIINITVVLARVVADPESLNGVVMAAGILVVVLSANTYEQLRGTHAHKSDRMQGERERERIRARTHGKGKRQTKQKHKETQTQVNRMQTKRKNLIKLAHLMCSPPPRGGGGS